MSTKQLHQIIRQFRAMSAATTDGWKTGEDEVLADAARAELEAIEQAARAIAAEDVSGWVYDVRDRAAADASFTASTWEHPRVLAFGDAAQVIIDIAKETSK